MGEEAIQPASGDEKSVEPLPGSMTAIAAGLILTLIGSVLSSNWARETIINYVGFGMVLAGLCVFVFGIFGTITRTLKVRLGQQKLGGSKVAAGLLIRRVWAVGAGIVLVLVGSIVGGSYAKETLMNYAGFGLQLAGIAFLVLGTFETARISANIYIRNKQDSEKCGVKTRSLSERLRCFWKNLVTTRSLYNILGIMASLTLLLFSLWQLDIIVGGPVWYTEYGVGWHWDGPGAYADKPFQCFMWQTTIGQAYDTLFALIFISFIILFVSMFFWHRRTD